jgi:hypothetical protein
MIRCLSLVALVAIAWSGVPAVGAEQLPEPRAAVFGFMEPVASQGRMIGRRAADAVFVALADEAPWRLVERAEVERLSEAAGTSAPFAVAYIQMIGHQCSAELAVTGVVEVCEVNAQRGTAQVTLLVELVETLDGASLASHRGIGSAQRPAGEVATIDEIVDHALSEAARDVVRRLTRFDAASAMVAAAMPDGRIMLDGPEEPALRVGSKLLVLRRMGDEHAVVGALTVLESRLTVVYARPLAGEGFRQGDRAIVVAR